MIAACGLDCSRCDIFEATDNPIIAQQVVEWFKKEMDVEVKINDVHCLGCKGDRAAHWSPECWILLCCVDERKLDFCYQCEDFPCERLTQWAKEGKKYGEALSRLKKMKKREYINL